MEYFVQTIAQTAGDTLEQEITAITELSCDQLDQK